MGITRDTAPLVADAAHLLGKSLHGLSVCQLGNQYLMLCPTFGIGQAGNQIIVEPGGLVGTGEQWLRSMGAEVTSIDRNGLNGALPLNLSTQLPAEKAYDLVTNFGTSEHVMPCDRRGQYHCWLNIHHLCRTGGAMLHAIPHALQSAGHAGLAIWTYSRDFVSHLCGLCGYRLELVSECPDCIGHTAYLLHKLDSGPFCSFEQFATLPGLEVGNGC